jgi:glycosyltransferase involved in cell wall biosynthesis
MLRPMFVTGSLVHGGAERHSITVMNRLAERGHSCHAVYIKNDPSQLERIHRREGSTVRCMNAAHFIDRRAIEDFAAHIRCVRPSVIVAANGYALMNASLARFRARLPVPVVATFHTTQVFGAKEHIKMLIDRPFFWSAARTVYVCEMQSHYWRARGVCSRDNEVIHNGVDTGHFDRRISSDEQRSWREAYGLSVTDYVIGISAVLRPEKNHLQLVDAVAALRRMGIPARVLMIGDGPMRAAIEARARELGVESDVLITGFQQEVRPFIAACDVMVLCSVAVETFSLAALEAMAMGKPVIHAELGGAAEMISQGSNGFLFPVGDTKTLISKLALLANRSLSEEMGRTARSIVESRFSETAMVERYENLLVEVCSNRSSGTDSESRLAGMTRRNINSAGQSRSE